MDKGSELAGKLMKVTDIHPIIRETLIMQQQDIFFLRKQLIEQAQVIEQIIDKVIRRRICYFQAMACTVRVLICSIVLYHQNRVKILQAM